MSSVATTYDSSFTVCTYNVGRDIKDYGRLLRHQEVQEEIDSKAKGEKYTDANYTAVQRSAATHLANNAAVLCLQEVFNEDRPFIQTLKDRGFQMIHFARSDLPPGACGSALAIDTHRFRDIKNCSKEIELQDSNSRRTFKKDVAIATAVDRVTGQQVTFASAHAPGFDVNSRNDSIFKEGDDYCKEIADTLEGTVQVVGADMNSNRTEMRSTERFDVFTRKGFKVQSSGKSTNVNPDDEIHTQREIDFTFTKLPHASLGTKIKSIFCSTLMMSAENVKLEDGIGFDAAKNPSDHLPVFTKISITNRSKISQMRYGVIGVCSLISHAVAAFFARKKPTTP